MIVLLVAYLIFGGIPLILGFHYVRVDMSWHAVIAFVFAQVGVFVAYRINRALLHLWYRRQIRQLEVTL